MQHSNQHKCTTLEEIFAPSNRRFTSNCISTKYCPILTNHTSMESYLFSFQIMYKSQFKKKMTHVTGFVGTGSHLKINKRRLWWRLFLSLPPLCVCVVWHRADVMSLCLCLLSVSDLFSL